MRSYFLEMTDRDRGVYLTGLMDALRSDPLRESDFIRCVQMQGSLRIHDFLTQVARTKSGTLSLDVAPWFFYAARSLCGDELAQPPTDRGPDSAPAAANAPEVTIAPVPDAVLAAMAAAQPPPVRAEPRPTAQAGASAAPPGPASPESGRPPAWIVALIAGTATAAITLAAALVLFRRRARP
ncbi:hypothetical protein ABIE65_004317 [Constrictibacter sp. MBR-5]|jgi:hypothetical protein|uniref:hypothetical protein n=1 Tax=Constrictibacter sp. MBR-5 TaxID=3156467 RepID=UPI00339A385E